jgi:hypothetical protein
MEERISRFLRKSSTVKLYEELATFPVPTLTPEKRARNRSRR